MYLPKSTLRLALAGALVIGAGASVPAIAAVAAGHTASSSATAADSIVEVTKDNIAQVKEMGKTKPVVFLVTAPSWCGACKQLDPIIRKINADDNGKWILAIVDEDKSGGAEKEFSGITGIPTEIPWGKNGEMTNPGRKVGAGPEANHRKWIDDVIAAYGPVDPAPAPTSTTAPAPVPTTTPAPVPTSTTTAPVPVPTTSTPAPVPTTTVPVPDPTTTVPGPIPTTTVPVPDPTTTAPVPVPTTTAPTPEPTSTTTAPAPSGSVIEITTHEQFMAVLELSKTKPVVLRAQLDKMLPKLSGENGQWAAAYANAAGGSWVLANIDFNMAQPLFAMHSFPLSGMPELLVIKDGKVVGSPLVGHSSKDEMGSWLSANAR